MRSTATFIGLALVTSASLMNCSKEATRASASAPPPSTVWWREQMADSHLREGGVASTPPGREEALVSALYSASRGWAARCAARPESIPAAEVRLEFDLQIDGRGRVLRARPRSALLLGVCLAEAMEQGAPLSVTFPNATELVVQLAFARSIPARSPR
jgi:hypothetical protein